MNKKSKNGITLVVLVVTIIIMMILFGVTFSTSTDLLANTQKNKIKSMLFMVRSKAEILLEDYMFNNDGNNLSEISDEYIVDKLGGSYVTDLEELKAVGYESDSTRNSK